MAVVTTKSGAITNRDTTPQVQNSAYLSGGMVRESVGTVEAANGDSIGSKYILASVPSNARISQILLYCDDVGTTTAADFGLYQTTLNGSAVVDADLFGSAISLSGGPLNGTDITHESAVFDPDDVEKQLWSALGLSSDPCLMYDVVATLTGAADAAGTISLKIRYVV